MPTLDSFPRLRFGHYPTPIEELPRLRAALGPNAPRILIKRDDYTGAGFGGNKVRKLEYVLAQAVTEGAEVVITSGGVKSNHARVTAALCARLSLECHLVLNDAAVMHEGWTPANLRLDQLFGATIHRVATRAERSATVAALAAQLRAAGRKGFVIPLGASIPLGALGFVAAARECAEQLTVLGARVDAAFHSSSSGGTQAGLAAGNQLFNFTHELIGVSPDDPAASIAAEVGRIIGGVGELLDAEFDKRVIVLDDYIGDGYGVPSAAGDEATVLLARAEGVVLDPVYTAKAMAALLDWIRQGKLVSNQTVLFWHTGGQLAHFYAPERER